MSITVANLMAQVGVDITQLKRGLNEADARMNLSAVRFAQSAKQVERMTQAAQHMEASAETKRTRATQILADQAKIQKEIEYSEQRASDLVKTSNRISFEKAVAQIQVKALQQSGAAYTNLTAQRNALSKAESNAAAFAKQAAAAKAKRDATSLVLATALQKKQAEHVQAQTVHAQSLTEAEQKRADEEIKQRQRVEKARKTYDAERDKSIAASDANIAKAKNRVLQVEGQYNVAHRRSDAMMEEVAWRHGATGIPQSVQDSMIAQHDKVEQLGRQLIQARANLDNAQQTAIPLPKSSDKRAEEQAKLQTLLHAPPVESPKTLVALEKATKTLRDMEAEEIRVNATQNAIVQNLEKQHAAAEANKIVEEQKLVALVRGNEEYAKLVVQEKIVADATRASVKTQRELNSEVSKQVGLKKQVEGIESRITSLKARAAQQSRSATNLGARAGETEELAQARFEMENAYALRKEQDAKSHGVRAASAVSGAFIGAGAVGLGALAVGEKEGADFNQMMLTAAHNTSLTNAQIKEMTATVKQLGEESGVSFDELADSYRKIENTGYKGKEIGDLLSASMKASVSQGAGMAETTQLLITTMKAYDQPVANASKVMNTLVGISRVANQNLGQMTHVFGGLVSIAGLYKISLAEVGAAFAVLTTHGQTETQALTQIRYAMNWSINPTKQMTKSLEDLEKRAHLVKGSLTSAFSYTGLGSTTISGMIDALNKASDKVKAAHEETLTKLFNTIRGQYGMTLLAGPGNAEFKGKIDTIRGREKEGTDQKEYQDQLKQTNTQMEILRNHFVVLASSIDTAFAPSIKKVVGQLDRLIGKFNSLDEQTKNGLLNNTEIGLGVAVTIGFMGKLIVGIGAVKDALISLGLSAKLAAVPGQAAAIVGTAVAGWGIGTAIRQNFIYTPEELTAQKERAVARSRSADEQKFTKLGAAGMQSQIAYSRKQLADLEKERQKSSYTGTEAGRKAYAESHLSDIIKQQDAIRARLARQKALFDSAQSQTPVGIAIKAVKDQRAAELQIKQADAAYERLYGHNKETPGADALSGLGGKAAKPRKEKTPKESEHDQMVDSYVSAMEQLKEAEYTTLHKDMGANEISARWATMSHGAVEADGEIRKLTGAYINMSVAERQAYIEAGRHNDAIVKQKEQLEATKSALENNRVKFTIEQDPTGKRQILEDLADGKYKQYGEGAADVVKSNIKAGQDAQDKRVSDKTAAALEESQAKSMRNTAEAAKVYANALESARDALQKLQDEGKEIGGKPQTYLDAANRSIEDRNKGKSPNWLQQAADEQLRILAKRTDIQEGLNVQDQKAVNLKNYLANAEERARDAAITSANPNDKSGDYQRQAIQSYGRDKFNQESPNKQAEILKQIADSYNKIIAPATKAADANTIVADALKKVNEQFGQTHNTLVTNINDWNKLNQAQKDYLNQLQKYQTAKQTVQDAIGGISDIISKSLDDLHQHGFRNIFRDIANDFQNMLYDMGKKWVMAKITSGLQSSLAPGLNKAMGVGGAAPTPPTADASASTMDNVGTMTIQSAGSITIAGMDGMGAPSGMPNMPGSPGWDVDPGMTPGLSPSWMQSAAGMIPGMPAGAPGALSALGGLFAPSAGAGAGIDFGLDSLAGAFADGGTMFSDHSYLVGERGPEIVHPMSSGQVVPMGGRGTTVNIHVHGVTDAGSFNASRHQITQDMIRAVQGAQRR